MSDIVEWLRNAPSNEWGSGQLLKAAAEIERLRAALAAERERCAKSADRLLALKWEHVEPGFIDGYVNACGEIAAAIRNG
jgi:hypothetical protein